MHKLSADNFLILTPFFNYLLNKHFFIKLSEDYLRNFKIVFSMAELEQWRGSKTSKQKYRESFCNNF